MSVRRHEIITVTARKDPRSIINAMRSVPTDAFFETLEVEDVHSWDRGGGLGTLEFTFRREIHDE